MSRSEKCRTAMDWIGGSGRPDLTCEWKWKCCWIERVQGEACRLKRCVVLVWEGWEWHCEPKGAAVMEAAIEAEECLAWTLML